MKNKITIIFLFVTIFTTSYSQIGGYAGAFSRLGFGARGMGMGNAMSSISIGDIQAYYNPALIPFAQEKIINITYSFLPFDRYLNFLGYGQSIKPTAGIALGIINAGVTDIEERDFDGNLIGNINTSENAFILSFGNRIHTNLSIGLSVKLFYYKLYSKLSSTNVGFDMGILAKITENINLSAVLVDINSKYQWNTSIIYGKSGLTSTDHFPKLFRFGLSYKLPAELGIAAIEFENSSVKNNIFRFGTELALHKYFSIRAGLDRFQYQNNHSGIKPTLGYSINFDIENITVSMDYAYIVEPFSSTNNHIITLLFKIDKN